MKHELELIRLITTPCDIRGVLNFDSDFPNNTLIIAHSVIVSARHAR